MSAIRSSIEVALASGRTNEECEELLAAIIEESASLELLVNQLLSLSETETERLKVDKQEMQFHDLVEKAMDMFGGVAEFREIQLVCPAFLLLLLLVFLGMGNTLINCSLGPAPEHSNHAQFRDNCAMVAPIAVCMLLTFALGVYNPPLLTEWVDSAVQFLQRAPSGG